MFSKIKVFGIATHLILLLALPPVMISTVSWAGAKESMITPPKPVNEQASDPMLKTGDLVKVDYTVTLEDGSLVYTTRSGTAHDGSTRKASGYTEPTTFSPEDVVAGKTAKMPGVGEAIAGVAIGQKKQITLSPESAFGSSDPKKIATFTTVRTFPRIVVMPPLAFYQEYPLFPIKGREIQFAPFMKARVKEVEETSVSLELLAKDGEEATEEFGKITIHVDNKQVTTTLTPIIGAPFKMDKAQGIISGTDGKNFTVDFNNPLAGKKLLIDMEVVGREALPEAVYADLPWIEDYDKGLAMAKKEGKPAVLVLYAGWCGWSKKLLNDSFQDPRVKLLRDKLVWVKVDSDKDKDLYKKYEQNGFPLIIMVGTDEGVVKRIDGFAEGGALREALGELIEHSLPKKS